MALCTFLPMLVFPPPQQINCLIFVIIALNCVQKNTHQSPNFVV